MPTSAFDPYSEEREQLRRRRAIAEAITAQSQQPLAPMPQGAIASRRSPLEGMAQLARAYVGAQGMKQADTESKGLAEAQRSDAYNAFSDFQRETTPRDAIARSLTEDVAGVHETDAIPAHTPNPEAQRASAMKYMSRVDPRQAGQMMAQQALKGPEYKDLGNAIGVFQNGVKIGEIPKGVSPDADAAQAGQDRRLGITETSQDRRFALGQEGQDRRQEAGEAGQDRRLSVTDRRAELGQGLTARGQNMAANTAAAGHQMTGRGQDMAAATAAAGHGVTARGQDLSAATAAAGQGVQLLGQERTEAARRDTAARPNAAQQSLSMGVENTRAAIKGYRDALTTWGGTDILSPAKRAEMGTTYNNMLLQAKEAYRLGVLAGPDMKILEELITSPTTTRGFIAGKPALDSQAKKLDEIMERIGRVAGGSGVAPPSNGATGGWQVRLKQ